MTKGQTRLLLGLVLVVVIAFPLAFKSRMNLDAAEIKRLKALKAQPLRLWDVEVEFGEVNVLRKGNRPRVQAYPVKVDGQNYILFASMDGGLALLKVERKEEDGAHNVQGQTR